MQLLKAVFSYFHLLQKLQYIQCCALLFFPQLRCLELLNFPFLWGKTTKAQPLVDNYFEDPIFSGKKQHCEIHN